MGLTELGYTRKTYAEILDGKIQKAKELFGDDIDTSEQTPLGKFLRINAYDQSELEETAELVYYSRFPNTATGTSLDRLCAFAGISRNPATAATFKVTATGTASETIPIGFLVGTESEVQFYNAVATTFDSNGTAEITVVCTEAGEIGNVAPADINKIVNPDANITDVVGTEIITLGEDVESDYSLRKRFAMAQEGLGSCNENALRASLLKVPTVTSAGVVVNDTDSTDSKSRPPHSFECYVSGGENYHKEIADIIFEKKPIGIKTYGTSSYDVTDDGGHTHTIKFSHTEYIDVVVYVKIKKNLAFEGDAGKTEIAENLTTYINSLGVGNKVIISALYGQIHAVTGVEEVTELKLSTDNGKNYSTGNLSISEWQIARCTKVTVEVA